MERGAEKIFSVCHYLSLGEKMDDLERKKNHQEFGTKSNQNSYFWPWMMGWWDEGIISALGGLSRLCHDLNSIHAHKVRNGGSCISNEWLEGFFDFSFNSWKNFFHKSYLIERQWKFGLMENVKRLSSFGYLVNKNLASIRQEPCKIHFFVITSTRSTYIY